MPARACPADKRYQRFQHHAFISAGPRFPVGALQLLRTLERRSGREEKARKSCARGFHRKRQCALLAARGRGGGARNNRARPLPLRQRFERPAALNQWPLEQKFSVRIEQIKGHENHRRLLAHLRRGSLAPEPRLERSEGKGAALAFSIPFRRRIPGSIPGRIPSQDLSVQDRRLGEAGEGLDDLGKARRDLVARAGKNRDPPGLSSIAAMNLRPNAVVFVFEMSLVFTFVRQIGRVPGFLTRRGARGGFRTAGRGPSTMRRSTMRRSARKRSRASSTEATGLASMNPSG